MFHLLENENHRVQQFQDAVQEQEYFNVVEKLVRRAFEKAKDVSIYDGKSAHEPFPDTIGQVHYLVHYLKINKLQENKRVIIYELMHEMGHLFDPIQLDSSIDPNSEHPNSQRSREIRAWMFADEEFKNHPELKCYTQEYTEHQRTCLLSYKILI